MRLPRSPLETRCLQTGVSLLLASQCFIGALPGFAEPVALAGAPAAVEQLSSQAAMPSAAGAPAPGSSATQSALQGLMSLEQARDLSALQDMGSLPSDQKVALRKVSVTNSQLMDKGALRVLKTGQEFAERGADPETQTLDQAVLRKAEGRFTLLIDELAPTFAGGYSNRANVRVALKDYAGAVADYEVALRLSPLADDAWINWLNRGSTLLAAGEAERALTPTLAPTLAQTLARTLTLVLALIPSPEPNPRPDPSPDPRPDPRPEPNQARRSGLSPTCSARSSSAKRRPRRAPTRRRS